MKSRICFVVQRYGLEVNGGAELHCRQLAEHLLGKYKDVHVITTKAIDYLTWANEYKADEEEINGVIVHRFPVNKARKIKEFSKINEEFLRNGLPESREQEWIDKQGPYCPKAIQYIEESKDDYDVFIFFTYLYYTSVMGIPKVKDKAIVIPTAHDEPYHKMKIFRNVFMEPRSFFFNTEEERELVHSLYFNTQIPSKLGGIGVEIPADASGERFKAKYNLDKYMLYIGRIDVAKNCGILFQYFQEYKKRNASDLKLVLMGKAVMEIPREKDIISLGFVDDKDKFDGIAGAEMLVMPSEFESLSMVVLEAMSLYTPVIVNGMCPVLKGHCIKSNGAFYYNNFFEFEGEVNYLLTHEVERKSMCHNAKQYVDENFQWDKIIESLCSLIEAI